MVLLLIALGLPACSGYHLILEEATVLEHDANHLAYRAVVKNERQGGASCKATRFYGATALNVYLANAPSRKEASIVKAAGGGTRFGRPIPDDPNNAYGFRVIEVGESFPLQFNNVTPENGIDVNATPYVIFELTSSTAKNYGQIDRTGTGAAGCIRYGETRAVDLRSVP